MIIGVSIGGIFLVLFTLLGILLRYYHQHKSMQEDLCELKRWTVPDPTSPDGSLVERVTKIEHEVTGTNGRNLARTVEDIDRKLLLHLADPDAHHRHPKKGDNP